MWDKNFKNKKFSKLFSFLNTKVEFCCGLAEYKGDYLATFAVQDNASYILKIPGAYLKTFLNE